MILRRGVGDFRVVGVVTVLRQFLGQGGSG